MIEGKKTRLRAIERTDIPTFVRWFNDPEVRYYLQMYMPLSMAEEEKWFERQLEDRDNKVFAIETAEGIHIGNCGLDCIDWRNGNAELGIVIGEKDYWGKGYGSDAITTLLRFAFHEMGLHRIYLRVDDDNERGIRCYERCGFWREGILREAVLREGRYHDHLVMGILRDEFESVSADG